MKELFGVICSIFRGLDFFFDNSILTYRAYSLSFQFVKLFQKYIDIVSSGIMAKKRNSAGKNIPEAVLFLFERFDFTIIRVGCIVI